MSKYHKELQRIMGDKSPSPNTTMSRAKIEAQIASVSEQLKGPMSNTERLLLVDDRQTLRKMLGAIEQVEG